MNREPFVKLTPVFKDYLWGGGKLKQLYHAKEAIVAEAWLLSAHPDGESVIAEGKHTGMPFREYLTHGNEEKGEASFGQQPLPQNEKEGEAPFPILVKLIDSAKKLSVQVHPDDDYARVHEHDNGKNEMWLVLEAEPDAYLYVGFNREMTREEVARRVADGSIEEVLNRIPTRAGDAIFIPAGTVHAIGEGNLILEVQQSSNATYRLYDYQRRGADGALRPLHLDKALDVLDYRKYDGANAQCPYFDVHRQPLHGSLALPMADGRFASVICVGGDGTLARDGQETAFARGDSLYLPAGTAPAELRGDADLIITRAAL